MAGLEGWGRGLLRFLQDRDALWNPNRVRGWRSFLASRPATVIGGYRRSRDGFASAIPIREAFLAPATGYAIRIGV